MKISLWEFTGLITLVATIFGIWLWYADFKREKR